MSQVTKHAYDIEPITETVEALLEIIHHYGRDALPYTSVPEPLDSVDGVEEVTYRVDSQFLPTSHDIAISVQVKSDRFVEAGDHSICSDKTFPFVTLADELKSCFPRQAAPEQPHWRFHRSHPFSYDPTVYQLKVTTDLTAVRAYP